MKYDIAFSGYAPDYDPTTQGIITDCSALVPTTQGYQAAPSQVSVGMDALAASCRGVVVARLLDETNRLIAGTQTKLYERSSLTWNDITRGSSDYTGGSDSRWRFTQYGNYTIATNRIDEMQVSDPGNDFDDLAGTPPKASIVETVADFVMAFDYDDGVDDFSDGWFCSALGDHTDWTPSIATQSANGRLTDVTGQIRAARRLGSNIVAYKERGLWLGTYDGPPVIWRWQHIQGEAGAVSQEAVVEIVYNGGPAHIAMGYDDFYLFDGSRPVSVGGPVRRYYQNTVNSTYRYKSIAMHDRKEGIVRFYYASSSSTTLDTCLAYNYRTDKWGRDDAAVEAALEYLSATITWDGLGTLYSTWDDLPNIAYDSPFWSAAQAVPAVFNTSHTLNSLTGVAGTSTITTGYNGMNDKYNTLVRVRPQFTSQMVSSGTMVNNYVHSLGDTDSVDSSVSLNSNRFDLLRSARWHKQKFTFVGDYTITGCSLFYEEDGEE